MLVRVDSPLVVLLVRSLGSGSAPLGVLGSMLVGLAVPAAFDRVLLLALALPGEDFFV